MSRTHEFTIPTPLITDQLPERFHGDEPAYSAVVLQPANDTIELHEVTIPRVDINSATFESAFDDVQQTLTIIEDPKSNKVFEISTVNYTTDAPYDAEISTYNSAISSNNPNGWEFAENAAANPDKPRIYIASFGNGFSSYLDKQEQLHLRKTGSYLHQETEPGHLEALPTVKALYRALLSKGIIIDRLSANSAGGNVATALMTEIPEGQLTHAYFKGRPNMVNHNAAALGYRMLGAENMKAGKANKAASNDPWALNDEMIERAKRELTEPSQRVAQAAQKLSTTAAVKKLVTDGIAFSKGAHNGAASPAELDTHVAVQHHPDAKLTLHTTTNDQLYKSNFDSLATVLSVAATGSTLQSNIQGLITPGSHADHTFTPSVRWTTERYAFQR